MSRLVSPEGGACNSLHKIVCSAVIQASDVQSGVLSTRASVSTSGRGVGRYWAVGTSCRKWGRLSRDKLSAAASMSLPGRYTGSGKSW